MGSQAVLHEISEAGSDEMKRHMKQLWSHFINSVAVGRPVIFLPKFMGDQIGEPAMEDMAIRFSVLLSGQICIQYNPALDAYCIGPMENLPYPRVFRIIKRVKYDRKSMVFPTQSFWTPPTPAVSGAVVTSSAIESNATLVTAPKVSKSPNSFMLFRKDKYAEYCISNVSPVTQSTFSRIAADMWRDAAPAVRSHYTQLARERKMRGEEETQREKSATNPSTKNNSQFPGQSSGHPSRTALPAISNVSDQTQRLTG